MIYIFLYHLSRTYFTKKKQGYKFISFKSFISLKHWKNSQIKKPYCDFQEIIIFCFFNVFYSKILCFIIRYEELTEFCSKFYVFQAQISMKIEIFQNVNK